MKRVVVPELLDSDAGTPREVAASLYDLRMLNRFFWRSPYHDHSKDAMLVTSTGRPSFLNL